MHRFSKGQDGKRKGTTATSCIVPFFLKMLQSKDAESLESVWEGSAAAVRQYEERLFTACFKHGQVIGHSLKVQKILICFDQTVLRPNLEVKSAL